MFCDQAGIANLVYQESVADLEFLSCFPSIPVIGAQRREDYVFLAGPDDLFAQAL